MASAKRFLAGAVRRRCGEGRKFQVLGHAFGTWINTDPPASTAVEEAVVPYLARYLWDAERVGIQCGRLAGFAAGGVLAILLVALAVGVRLVA